MNILITGHTRGLGKYLYERLNKEGHNCIGFSRSNGFDIEDQFFQIIDQTKNFDLFINNAHKKNIQSNFLKSLKDANIDIISIGATSSLFYNEKKSYYIGKKLQYLEDKKKLLDTHIDLCYKTKGSILLINIDSLENHPTKSAESINFKTIYDTINFWLKNKQLTIVNYLSQNGE